MPRPALDTPARPSPLHVDEGVRAGLPGGCRRQTMEVGSPTRCIRSAEGLDEATGAARRGFNPKRHMWEASGHIGLVRPAEEADYVDDQPHKNAPGDSSLALADCPSRHWPSGAARHGASRPQSLVAASQGEDTGVPGKETDALARAEGRRVVQIRLPHAHLATIDRDKITDYLLSSVSPRGRAKAGFFIRFGFSAARWEELAAALRRHAASHAVAAGSGNPIRASLSHRRRDRVSGRPQSACENRLADRSRRRLSQVH